MAEKVVIYSTQGCIWCKRAKEFFKKNKIDYEEFDVGKDESKANEMVEKSGQMGVPVIEVMGEIVVGFDEERLKELLQIT